MTRRFMAAAGAAVATAALALPATGQAALLSVSGTVNLGLTPVLSGQNQLLDGLGGLTCPTLGQVGCAVGALDLRFVTELETSGAPIKRSQAAVVNVPTPLNVDGDIAPDVIGTLKVLSLSKFELVLERALGETATLPLKAEAIVDDPTGGTLPRDHINVGYDAQGTRAPQKWSTVAELPTAAPGSTVVETTTTVLGGGGHIATLAGLFDGDAADRQSPMGGRLKYTPAPATAKLGLTLGPKMAVRAGAGQPVELDATAVLADGPRRKDVTVGLAPLPGFLEVSFEEPAVEQRKVVYTASAPVEDVDATYTDSLGSVVGTKVVAQAHDLPTGMTVEQTSARAGTFTATGGDLGSVEVGFANGEPRLLDEDNPYAHVIEEGTLKSFAGRIDGLRSATVDATDGVDVDLQLGPDARKKLHGVVKYGGKDIDATISDLPRHIDFAFKPATGAIDYDAFGETIQKITAKATSTTPFVDRATRVEGEITGLPPVAHIKATPGANGFSLNTDAPIGAADVLLSSGPDGGLEEGENGADVVDTAEAFVAHARVHGLRKVEVGLGKDGAGEITQIDGKLQLASEPTVVRYDGKDLDLDADLSAIPDDVTLSFDKGAGTLGYHASGGIERITAEVDSAKPLLKSAKHIEAKVLGVPANATVGYKPADGAEGFNLNTDAPITHADVLLTSGPQSGLGKGQIGVDVTDTAEAFVAHARVNDLRKVDVALTKDSAGELKKVAAKLQIKSEPTVVRMDGADLDLNAGLSAVPNEVDLTFDKDLGSLIYKASAGIERIDATVDTVKPLFDQAKHLEAAVEDLPAEVSLGFKPANGADGATFTPSAKIGMLEARITDGITKAPELPEGKTMVALRKLPKEFAIAARLYELKGGRVELLGKDIDAELHLDPRPDGTRQDVDIDVDADIAGDAVAAPLDLAAHVEDLPNDLVLKLNADKLDYTASAEIPQLTAQVRNLPQGNPGDSLAGKPLHVNATVNEVPARLEVFLEDIELKPAEGADLGRVDFELWDGGDAYPALPEDGRNKLVFNKFDGGLHVQGRLLAGLSHAKLELPKEPAGPLNSQTRVTTGFSSPPAPLDVTMDSGTPEDPSHLDVVVNELKTQQQFTIGDYDGLRVDWRTNEPGTDVALDVSTKSVGTDLDITDLPTVAQFCVDSDQVDPDLPPHTASCVTDVRRQYRVNDKDVIVPTDVAIFTEANGLLRLNGWVCLPPTNKDGERVGDVNGSCVDRSATNRLEINELWLQDTALALYSGDTLTRNEDGDGPEEDELLKLHLRTDDTGIRVRNLFIRNTVADKRTRISAGWKEVDDVPQPVGDTLRSIGQTFQLLADLSGIPNAEFLRGQLQCDDVHVGVWIILGSFDVIPGLAETVLGDVCK